MLQMQPKPGVAILALTLALIPFSLCAAVLSKKVPMETQKPAYAEPWQRYSGWEAIDWKAFSTLTESRPSTPPPLQKLDGPIQGNAEKGKALVGDRKRGGSCYACHIFPGADLPGNVGPSLASIGGASRPDEYLLNYIYDPRTMNPTSVMPPWGTHGVFTREEIIDIIAYLKTLNKPVEFKNAEDDPEKRPIPKEERDNLDDVENPGMFAVSEGEPLYTKACASCHKDRTVFKKWAANMPKFDPRMKKVLGVEEFITRHARATSHDEFPMEGKENIALSVFMRHLANGERINVETKDPGSQAALKRGEDLSKRKLGQLNFACTDCHQIAARRWIRGQYLAGMESMIDHFPTYRTSRGEIWDIRKRFQWCNVAIRANELPPDAAAYGDLELYLTQRNNGLKLSVPGIRH
jgi:L-cysteine S-thiosulfotransferase